MIYDNPDPRFNLPSTGEESNGVWCHSREGFHLGFRDKALILPTIRLSYCRLDYKILCVQDTPSVVRIIIKVAYRLETIEFHYYGLYRTPQHL